jgi:hypothetical protein
MVRVALYRYKEVIGNLMWGVPTVSDPYRFIVVGASREKLAFQTVVLYVLHCLKEIVPDE